jgi:hypothetical protein
VIVLVVASRAPADEFDTIREEPAGYQLPHDRLTQVDVGLGRCRYDDRGRARSGDGIGYVLGDLEAARTNGWTNGGHERIPRAGECRERLGDHAQGNASPACVDRCDLFAVSCRDENGYAVRGPYSNGGGWRAAYHGVRFGAGRAQGVSVRHIHRAPVNLCGDAKGGG